MRPQPCRCATTAVCAEASVRRAQLPLRWVPFGGMARELCVSWISRAHQITDRQLALDVAGGMAVVLRLRCPVAGGNGDGCGRLRVCIGMVH